MKDQFLKLAGVKSEKEFYKKFPTEEAFMAKYGKQVKKLAGGGAMAAINKLAGSNAFATGVQSLGDVVGGVQQMKDEKNLLDRTIQGEELSKIALQASMTKPEQVKRKYVRPEDNVNTGEEFFPIYGAGTVLAKNGAEIANTFAPNTIYTDLEEAQFGLNLPEFKTFPDFLKNPMKQGSDKEVSDIYEFAKEGGADALAQVTAGLGSPKGKGVSGAGRVGGGVGATAGMLIGGPVGSMIGKFAGQTIGNLVDQKAEKTEKAKKATDRNIEMMTMNQGAQSLQQQNYSYMEHGGFVNPQVATELEGIKLTKLFAPDPTMDTLRTGGHIRQNYLAMGGDLKVHRGKAEPMSYNPYLGSETVMFKGPSHDDGGMPIEFGNNPVEVEGGEPAVKLRNGSDGSSNLTVYGNLKIPSFGAAMMGDPKAKGQKFKNYVADLSKKEERQNKLMDKSVTALDELDTNTPYDMLSMSSYKSNMLGANMKLKDIADKKIKAASLQEAINNTAEEMGLSADDLAKGNVKKAKMGAKITIAKDGVITKEERAKAKQLYESGDIKGFQQYIQDIDPNMVKTIIREQGMPNAGTFVDALKGPRTEEAYKRIMNPVAYETPGSRMPERKPQIQLPSNMPGVSVERPTSDATATQSEDNKFDWMTLANQVLPYVRPTDAESLDPRQLAGEMYALSTNQVEPVRAQTFQPQLSTPYDISLQDIVNKNQSDYRAAQRMMGYNPAAQAMLNAQKYQANQQVLGEQFRMNQAMKDQVYKENRGLLDQAKLQNLQILDQQYGRQQQALSNTKATTQAALNSIASKYAQNQLENRTLQTYENLYNYRFDPRFRAMNMNPLAQWTTDLTGAVSQSPEDVQQEETVTKDAMGRVVKSTSKTKTGRNGALVKAIKSM